jgi:peptidoglycan/LPS O-acetylase OafA/YrhL
LRFFAALQVLLMHLVPQPLRGTLWYAPLISAGDEAVIFFFVLSGFILSYVYSGENEDAAFSTPVGRFWQARLARLLPAYVIGLILMLPIFAYSTFVSHLVPPSIFWSSLVLVPLFLQSWYPPTADAWNGVAWSLSVEWLFYALFPVLQTTTSKIGRWSFLAGAWLLLFAFSLLRGAIEATPDGIAPSTWRLFVTCFPPFHLPTFLLGMAVGRLFLFGPRLSTAVHVRIFLAGSTAVAMLLGAREYVPSWALSGPIVVSLFCIVIYGGARIGGSFKWLTGSTFVLLGEASYALYILHPSVTLWCDQIARLLGHHPPVAVISWAALAIVASVICFRYVETPMRRQILHWRLPAALRCN